MPALTAFAPALTSTRLPAEKSRRSPRCRWPERATPSAPGTRVSTSLRAEVRWLVSETAVRQKTELKLLANVSDAASLRTAMRPTSRSQGPRRLPMASPHRLKSPPARTDRANDADGETRHRKRPLTS